MRRSTLAIGLLLAVLLPIPSPAEDAAAAGDEASTTAEEGEASADEAASQAGSSEADAPTEAASEEPEEASGDAAETSGEKKEAAGEEEAAPEEASADAAEGEGESDEEEGGFGASLLDYANNTRTQFLTGLNGLLTWPADPVMATVNPPKAFDKATWKRRPLGFGSGLLLMVYRAFTGTLDLALAPGPMPVMSPVPRYKLIPGFEHEDE
jgi:hypothetical protein